MKVKMSEIPERTPEERHKDNLPILAKMLCEIDKQQSAVDYLIKAKDNLIRDYLYDYKLQDFLQEYEEFKMNNEKRKAYMEKYSINK